MTRPMPEERKKLEPCPFCGSDLIPMIVDGETFQHQGLLAMQHIAASECFLACQRVVGRREYERWNRRSISASERGLREALERIARLADPALNSRAVKAIRTEALAALSPKGEDEQARGQGRSAPTHTDTKDTTR